MRTNEQGADLGDAEPATKETAEVIEATRTGGALPSDSHSTLSDGPMPRRIGRYLLISELGRGGMGVVYCGYDPNLHRRLAIKVLRVSARRKASRERAQARMLREAQALAKVNDPRVVSVHDVGTLDSGDVFIAMEHVEGRTLEEACRDATWRDILVLYRSAATGLAACHRHGVLHRDFKPSNVLVTKRGEPVIVDFGLARATGHEGADDLDVTESAESEEISASLTASGESSATGLLATPLTVHGEFLGTPAFMSPEQFSGAAITPASDQFNFCAALYRTLYRQSCFPKADLEQLAKHVREGRVQPPPKDTRVPKWVHSIIMRGLSVDPVDRYPSMEALAAALAKDPGRRRRFYAVAAIVAIGGLGVAAAQQHEEAAEAAACSAEGARIREVWNDAQAEKLASAFAAFGNENAGETSERVDKALDAYAQRWQRARTEVCNAARALPAGDKTVERARACFDDRRSMLDNLVSELVVPTPATVQRAVLAVASLLPVALCTEERSLAMRFANAAPETEATRVVRQKIGRAQALRYVGDFVAATRSAQDALEQAQELEHPELAVEARLAFATPAISIGDVDLGTEHLQRAFFDADRLGLDLEAFEAAAKLAVISAQMHRDIDRAKLWIQSARSKLERAGAGARDIEQAMLRHAESSIAMASQSPKEAALHLRGAIDITAAALGEDHPSIAGLLMNLALVHEMSGNAQQARRTMLISLRMLEKSLGPSHLQVGNHESNLGAHLSNHGEPHEALAHLTRALRIAESHDEDGNSLRWQAHHELGRVHYALGNLDDAEDHLRSALQVPVPAHEDKERARVQYFLAELLWERGHARDRALELAHEAMANLTALSQEREAADISAWLAERQPRALPSKGRGMGRGF